MDQIEKEEKYIDKILKRTALVAMMMHEGYVNSAIAAAYNKDSERTVQ